ncbi:hypothetical protein M1D80_21705 [Phyllobacteriaceae bacterium JZ32]
MKDFCRWDILISFDRSDNKPIINTATYIDRPIKRNPAKPDSTNCSIGVRGYVSRSADRIGLIILDTDNDQVELVSNCIVAERLMDVIVEFLQKEEGKDAPAFAMVAVARNASAAQSNAKKPPAP